MSITESTNIIFKDRHMFFIILVIYYLIEGTRFLLKNLMFCVKKSAFYFIKIHSHILKPFCGDFFETDIFHSSIIIPFIANFLNLFIVFKLMVELNYYKNIC